MAVSVKHQHLGTDGDHSGKNVNVSLLTMTTNTKHPPALLRVVLSNCRTVYLQQHGPKMCVGYSKPDGTRARVKFEGGRHGNKH